MQDFSYEQQLDYKDLWFDTIKFEALLKRINHPQQKGDEDHKPNLQDSPYWCALQKLTTDAIEKYPAWQKMQKSVKITANLLEWLKELGANSREADVVKKTLSDFYKELN